MREGIHVIIGNPILKRLAGCAATGNLGSNMIGAVIVIYAFNYLHLSTIEFGLIGTIGAVGFVVGALVSGRFTARFGVGVSLALSTLSGFVAIANPLAQYGYPFFILAAVSFLVGMLLPIYNINAVSLRQAITPNRLQGRMNATMRTIIWGTIPIGAIIGGVLGGLIGVVNTLYLGAAVAGFSTTWIVFGPVVRVKTQPTPIVD